MKSIEQRLREEAPLARTPVRPERIERVLEALAATPDPVAEAGPSRAPVLLRWGVAAAAAVLAVFFGARMFRAPAGPELSPAAALGVAVGELPSEVPPGDGWNWTRSPLVLPLLADASGAVRFSDPLSEEFSRLRQDTLNSARFVLSVLPPAPSAR